MTDQAPERIWVRYTENGAHVRMWTSGEPEQPWEGNFYIRADPAALLASPEVQALVDAARAEGARAERERCVGFLNGWSEQVQAIKAPASHVVSIILSEAAAAIREGT